jgi:murein DD-endopeptidase MepM/ murein hydrolase activator NlpD
LSAARPGAASRHRTLSAIVSALRNKPARVAAAAVAGSALLVFAWPVATHWMARAPSQAWVDQADALGLQLAASLGAQARQQPEIVSAGIAVVPGYRNPFRGVSGLIPERIDEGVDFGGSGPVYALGDAVITNATGNSAGWPGGGWITYQLTDGPEAGLMVYVAEDVTPAVQVGQHVLAATVIASMFAGGDGIETGWAQPSGLSAESQLPEAGGISGSGPFPTRIGVNFDELLQSLGVPAAPNRTQPAYGLLPASYPAN